MFVHDKFIQSHQIYDWSESPIWFKYNKQIWNKLSLFMRRRFNKFLSLTCHLFHFVPESFVHYKSWCHLAICFDMELCQIQFYNHQQFVKIHLSHVKQFPCSKTFTYFWYPWIYLSVMLNISLLRHVHFTPATICIHVAILIRVIIFKAYSSHLSRNPISHFFIPWATSSPKEEMRWGCSDYRYTKILHFQVGSQHISSA